MFDTNKMPSVTLCDGKPRYLFVGDYLTALNTHIDYINTLLIHYHKTSIPNFFIPALNFYVDKNFKGPTNFTFLWLNDKTPTGKKPKYVYTVHFNTFKGDYMKEWGNDTFGEIYYLQDGNIGKVHITMWRNKKLHIIHLKKINGILSINKIEEK